MRAALLALALVLTPFSPGPAQSAGSAAAQSSPAPSAPASPRPTVWLVANAGRPAVVRYLESHLRDVPIHTVRRPTELPAREGLVVTVERREATIARQVDGELRVVRTLSLPSGLDTAGRARLGHALRTLLAR